MYPNGGTGEVADALKLHGKPISKVADYCQTGTDAFRFATFAIAAGVYDTVLVLGFDKPKDRGVSGPTVSFDSVRGLPATPAGWFLPKCPRGCPGRSRLAGQPKPTVSSPRGCKTSTATSSR